MTLVVTVGGRESIWLCADRRLSVPGRRPRDDARKLIIMETGNGDAALVGYAGLGSTGRGTEPSDWMAAVLRGRNLTVEESLGVLASAMMRELPKHVRGLPGVEGPMHFAIAAALLDREREARAYTLSLFLTPDRRRWRFGYTQWFDQRSVGATRLRPMRILFTGSGAVHLEKRDKRWMRDLLTVVRASDAGKLSPRIVADHLAALNNSVSRQDHFVSPECIVAWRNRKGGVHGGGGSSACYIGPTLDPNGVAVPIISNGLDVLGLVRALRRWERGGGAAEEGLGQRPPDEKLR